MTLSAEISDAWPAASNLQGASSECSSSDDKYATSSTNFPSVCPTSKYPGTKSSPAYHLGVSVVHAVYLQATAPPADIPVVTAELCRASDIFQGQDMKFSEVLLIIYQIFFLLSNIAVVR